jgi:hypothetical protein
MKDKNPITYILEILVVVLVALKLFKLIHWSWWIILSPVWGGIVAATFVVLVKLILGKYTKND